MNKMIQRMMGLSLTVMLVMSTVTFADGADYGSAGAAEKGEYTNEYSIEEMLIYALQDEYAARAEYNAIQNVFGEQRPFSNIEKSEERHIEWLLPLFEEYGVDLIEDTAVDHLLIPETLAEAFTVGVQAEIANIAMYDKFLDQELPDDIRSVFESLKSASENHLKAFERGTERSGGRRNGGRFSN